MYDHYIPIIVITILGIKVSTIKVVINIMIIILIIVIIIIMMRIIFILKLLYHNLQGKREINYDMTHDAIIFEREDYGYITMWKKRMGKVTKSKVKTKSKTKLKIK